MKRKTTKKLMNEETQVVFCVNDYVEITCVEETPHCLPLGRIKSLTKEFGKRATVVLQITKDYYCVPISNLKKLTYQEYIKRIEEHAINLVVGEKNYNIMRKFGYSMNDYVSGDNTTFEKTIHFNNRNFCYRVRNAYLLGSPDYDKPFAFKNEVVLFSNIETQQDINDLQIAYNRFKDELKLIMAEIKGE